MQLARTCTSVSECALRQLFIPKAGVAYKQDRIERRFPNENVGEPLKKTNRGYHATLPAAAAVRTVTNLQQLYRRAVLEH